MGTLDVIITSNARTAIERARTDERLRHKNLSTRGIATAMSMYFLATINTKTGRTVPAPKADSIYPQLRALLKVPPRATWDSRYIEAFCRVLEMPPERLCAEDYDTAKRSTTDYAQYLIRSFGRELDSPKIQSFVRIMRHVASIPERFALLEKIAAILATAEYKSEADYQVSEAVRRSRNWETEHVEKAEDLG